MTIIAGSFNAKMLPVNSLCEVISAETISIFFIVVVWLAGYLPMGGGTAGFGSERSLSRSACQCRLFLVTLHQRITFSIGLAS